MTHQKKAVIFSFQNYNFYCGQWFLGLKKNSKLSDDVKSSGKSLVIAGIRSLRRNYPLRPMISSGLPSAVAGHYMQWYWHITKRCDSSMMFHPSFESLSLYSQQCISSQLLPTLWHCKLSYSQSVPHSPKQRFPMSVRSMRKVPGLLFLNRDFLSQSKTVETRAHFTHYFEQQNPEFWSSRIL